MTNNPSKQKTVRWVTVTPEWVLDVDCDGPNCEVVPAKAYDRLHATHAELERTVAVLRGAIAKATTQVRESLPHELRGAIKELLTESSQSETTVLRYTDGGSEGWMQSPTGEFVRYDDIKHLLHPETTCFQAPQGVGPELADSSAGTPPAPNWRLIGSEPRDVPLLCYWAPRVPRGPGAIGDAVHSSKGDGWHRPGYITEELNTPSYWVPMPLVPGSAVKSNCESSQ